MYPKEIKKRQQNIKNLTITGNFLKNTLKTYSKLVVNEETKLIVARCFRQDFIIGQHKPRQTSNSILKNPISPPILQHLN